MFTSRPSLRATLFLLALSGSAPAAEPGPDFIPIKPEQAQALGLVVQPLGGGEGSRSGGLPAQVVIPNPQLRVVTAPLAGVITALEVATGEPVKAGQILGRLSSPAALETRKEFQLAQTDNRLAEQSLTRDEQLFKEGIIPESRIQATRARAAQARTTLAERMQALGLAGMGTEGREGGQVLLRAPIAGVVLEQSATVGQRVEPASPLYRIGRLSPLWLEVQAPAALATGVRPGLAVSVAGTSARGKVIAVAQAANPATQAVLIRAEIASGAEQLRPGQTVEATLEHPARAGQWSVPAAAVARQGDKDYLMVQDSARGGFTARPVKVLGRTGDQALVAGPLQAGERIAVAGVAALKAAWMGIGKE